MKDGVRNTREDRQHEELQRSCDRAATELTRDRRDKVGSTPYGAFIDHSTRCHGDPYVPSTSVYGATEYMRTIPHPSDPGSIVSRIVIQVVQAA
jgi:hypothetical protein